MKAAILEALQWAEDEAAEIANSVQTDEECEAFTARSDRYAALVEQVESGGEITQAPALRGIELTPEEEALVRYWAEGCAHCFGAWGYDGVPVGPEELGFDCSFHCAYCLGGSCDCKCWETLGLPDPEEFTGAEIESLLTGLKGKGVVLRGEAGHADATVEVVEVPG